MRLLVCGSRDFNERQEFVENILNALITFDEQDATIIEGGAAGADSYASEYAHAYRFDHERYTADWQKYGHAAGLIRNQRMLEEGKPDLVVAFVNKPLAESRGTAHMVRIAREAGVRTIVVEVY